MTYATVARSLRDFATTKSFLLIFFSERHHIQ